MIFEGELRAATRALPSDLRAWMRMAVLERAAALCFGEYEDSDGGVCPVVAAAKLAGAWEGGRIVDGFETWGGPDGPTERVEDFVAYFDLVSDGKGVEHALGVVRSEIRLREEKEKPRRRVLAGACHRGRGSVERRGCERASGKSSSATSLATS